MVGYIHIVVLWYIQHQRTNGDKIMDCSCEIGDYEAPTVFQQKAVTARKQHKCYECNRAIKPGEDYLYTSGLWDGSWDSHKTCHFCAAVGEWTPCYSYGGLREAVINEVDYHGEEAVEKHYGKVSWAAICNHFNITF